MLNEYFNVAGYSCAMYSAWNPKNKYDISASVYVVSVTQMLIRC
jgi:hypothetical protein